MLTDTRGYTTTYTSDANRNPLTVTDTKQQSITTAYDLDNEALRVTHPDGSPADTSAV